MQDQTADFFRIFFETSQALLSSRSLRETLKLVVKRSVRALGAKSGSLRLVDEGTNRLELVASHLLSRTYREKGPLHLDRSIPEVLEQKVVVIPNAWDDPRVEYRDAKRAEGIDTILSVPMVARNRVIGVLRLYTGEPREFTELEIEFVSALAELGGLAVANAKVYEDAGVKLSSLLGEAGVELPRETGRYKQRFRHFPIRSGDVADTTEAFRALHHATTSILATLDSVEAQSLIIDRLVETIGVKAASLRWANETTGCLELVSSRGLSDAYLNKGAVHSDRSIGETMAGHPVLIDDAQSDPRTEYPEAAAREGIASILSIPIVARERVVGVLRLYADKARAYSRDDVVFVSALAEIAGIAIVNARLYERTRYDLSFWQTTIGYLENGDPEDG